MDDTLRNDAVEICSLLEERGAGDVLGLDLDRICSWAACMIIATAASRVHMRGLEKAVREAMTENGMEIKGAALRKNEENNWRIVDGGNLVVSLMDADARSFYALEQRWFEAPVLYGESQSSKSS